MVIPLPSVEDVGKALDLLVRSVRGAAAWRSRAKRQELVEALRTVYFFDDGALGYLRQLAEDGVCDPDRLAREAADFDADDQLVEAALGKFRSDNFRRDLGMTLLQIQGLAAIREAKIGVRRNVKFALESFLGGDDAKVRTDAAKLVSVITALNEKVVTAETAILGAAGARGAA